VKRPKILVVADVQARAGTPTKHLSAISRYIEAKRPDVIVCIGDFYDLPSLSKYSMNIEKEGARYRKDIDAGRASMDALMAWKKTAKNYKPRLVFVTGNHEYRIVRAIAENPNLEGVISMDDLGLESYGWKVYPFLKVVTVYGIQFSHYFVSGAKGMPVSSAAALLRVRQRSAIMGHVQVVDMAIHPRTQQTAIFAGLTNLHDEKYLGFQGNSCRRQVLMLHECRGGLFDPMFVSLSYLLHKYGSK
jgi:Calcineurin-like phosphoesterase